MNGKRRKYILLMVLSLAAVVLSLLAFVQHLQDGDRFKVFMNGLGAVVFGLWFLYYVTRYRKEVRSK